MRCGSLNHHASIIMNLMEALIKYSRIDADIVKDIENKNIYLRQKEKTMV